MAGTNSKRARSASSSSSTSTDEHTSRSHSQLNQQSSKRSKQNSLDDDSPSLSKERVSDSETGWVKESHSKPQLIALAIIHRLKNERESFPNETLSPTGQSAVPPSPIISASTLFEDLPALTLESIEDRVKAGTLSSLVNFDQELHQCFKKAERTYATDLQRLGAVYMLRRLYQELTKGDGSIALEDTVPVGACRKLSTVTMGPGNKYSLPKNDDQLKLRAKDKVILDGIRYKSDVFKTGDWVHLSNPDNPARPIVGQIFHTYKRFDNGQRMLTVCWYYRPEETVHHISRLFMQNEVFKTGNFIDHVIEAFFRIRDVLGRCLVLFYTKYLRGRPSAPLWTHDLPLYICEHRYKDDDYTFKKIKNWESCAPSNVRTEGHEENFQAFTTPLSVNTLVRVDSPFLIPATTNFQANGEPIILSPTELMKVLPKDQVKYYRQDYTLQKIESILGVLPSNPPRPPHLSRSPDSSAPQTPRLRASTPASNTPVPSTPVVAKPVTVNPVVHSQPSPAPPASAPPVSRHSNTGEITVGGRFGELLRQINPARKTPCVLDIYANQESFEKLPEVLLTQISKPTEDDQPRHPSLKPLEDLMWIAAPPTKSSLSSSAPEPLKHSKAYLAYLAATEKVNEVEGCVTSNAL
ncbi:hypothetical protein DFH28DRAFT_923937 [Melampsora americana]|nr:hypothetical protein DFH28DRAFT_923937 [Melampsora americana]